MPNIHLFNDISIEDTGCSIYILRADEGVCLSKRHMNELLGHIKQSLTYPSAFIIDKTTSYSLDGEFLLEIGNVAKQLPEIKAAAVVATSSAAIASAKLEISLAPSWKSAIFPDLESAKQWAQRQIAS